MPLPPAVLDQLARTGAPRLVLAALERVPRALFAADPDDWRGSIGTDGGARCGPPAVVAHVLRLLDPRPGCTVLEVGCGGGYTAAVLAEAGCRVYALDSDPAAVAQAAARFARLGLDVQARVGDGAAGWPDELRFDRVLYSCGWPTPPVAGFDQLADDGRLVCPVGRRPDLVDRVVAYRADRTEAGSWMSRVEDPSSRAVLRAAWPPATSWPHTHP